MFSLILTWIMLNGSSSPQFKVKFLPVYWITIIGDVFGTVILMAVLEKLNLM